MAQKVTRQALAVKNSEELLSYIINVTPELKDEIDLPVQGEGIAKYGKIIMNNDRYRNAFLNTVNLIGLTVLKRNKWENPWKFTDRGTLRFGQQIREIVNDLCDVYDYNEYQFDTSKFLQNVNPNIYNYMHELNFQKVYQTTTSDEQMAMAFTNEDLFSYIDDLIGMLYESLEYDKYLVNKYMLARRIVDGTIPAIQISNFDMKTTREIVSEIKAISNKMTFRKPDYNPAGIRRAVSFENQIAIVNTDFDAKISTEVLATSYFRNDAEMKSNLALIDGFGDFDDNRLKELLGNSYIEFTPEEKAMLKKIPACIISKEFYMDYTYEMSAEGEGKATEFYNPLTLKNNHFLHFWGVFSTSPFEPCVVFVQDEPTVTGVTVSPATATVSAGIPVQLEAKVETTGFANKAVVWTTNSENPHITINSQGLLTIPSDIGPGEIIVTATSVYNKSVSGTATITVA